MSLAVVLFWEFQAGLTWIRVRMSSPEWVVRESLTKDRCSVGRGRCCLALLRDMKTRNLGISALTLLPVLTNLFLGKTFQLPRPQFPHI